MKPYFCLPRAPFVRAAAFVVFASLVAMVVACGGGGGGVLPANNIPTPFPKIKLYPIPTAGSFAAGITAGPDGDIWFVEGALGVNKVSRLDISTGTITEFPVTGCAESPEYVAPGSDGNLWVSEYCLKSKPFSGYPEIAKVKTDGTMLLIQMPGSENPFHEVLGPDGNVWFTLWASGMFGKITPSGVTHEWSLATQANPSPRPEGIKVGPDGNLWIADVQFVDVVRTNGKLVNEMHLPAVSADDLTFGPDGNLWIASYGENEIWRMSLDGSNAVALPVLGCGGGLSGPLNIVTGPDKAVWFSNALAASVGRIDMNGNYTSLCDGEGGWTFDLTVGPDRNIWFTATGSNEIGEVLLH